jgi:regulator of sirC expression with transglutaminase-like and TPR domain
MGADLAEKPLPATLVKALESNLDRYAKGAIKLQQSLKELLPNATAARRQLQEKRRQLQRQGQALRLLEDELHQASVREELARELNQPEGKVDLLRACLLLDSHDNPQVDVAHYQQQVQRLANELKRDPQIGKGTAQAVARIRQHLFEQGGFHGSRHDFGNRNNSYLSAVLDDREGLPISLSVLFIEVARKLGLREVFGLPLPGQFMVGWRDDPEGELHIIDPFEGGRERLAGELADELNDGEPLAPEMLEAAGSKAIVMRMINNLLNLARKDEDEGRVKAYLTLQITIEPDNALARLERAQLSHREGQLQQAREDVVWLNQNLPEQTPEHLRAQMRRWLDSLNEPQAR